MLYDRIDVEKHIYVATRTERIQNSEHSILTINAEGPQQPLNQRPDFAQAKRECKRLHHEHLARTQEEYRTIPRSQQTRFDKSINPQSFLVWKIRFKNQVTTCDDFPSEAMLWIKEEDMVDSLEELKSSRSVSGKIFQILRCWTRRLLLI